MRPPAIAGVLLAIAAINCALPATAQRKDPARVAALWTATREAAAPLLRSFEQGLAERGWVAGRNIEVEHRFSGGAPELATSLAEELVATKPDVLFAASDLGAFALRRQTTAIPIVIGASIDPIGSGLVASLAMPGGNVTGLAIASEAAKRMQMLREAVPGSSRIGVLYNAEFPGNASIVDRIQDVARSEGISIVLGPLRGPGDIDRAFESLMEGRVDAVLGVSDNLTFLLRREIAVLAQQARLPTAFPNREFCEAGALLCYGTDLAAMYRHAAGHVDRILRGAKPSELPMELPTKYDFLISLKTARALSLVLPDALLARADEVIE